MNEFSGFKRGINLGGWLSQCDYEPSHLESFITESDIELISSWGLDHIRLPFDFNIILDENGDLRNDAFLYLDRAAGWCEKHNLNMILDLHKTMGYSFDKGENETGFFDDKRYQDIFVNLWRKIAEHYAGYKDSIAFELLNEVTDKKYAEIWNSIAKRAIEEIRQYAPKNYILIGGIYNNSILGLKLLDKPYDDRIVYNFHYYNPLIFTHQKAYWIDNMPSDFTIDYPASAELYYKASDEILRKEQAYVFKQYGGEKIDINFMEWEIRQAVEVSKKMDVPIYCGEYGVIEVAPDNDTIRWQEDIHSIFELYGIGRAMWNFKGKDYGIVDKERENISKYLVELL